MKKLVLGLLLLSGLIVKAGDLIDIADPDCAVKLIVDLKEEGHIKQMLKEEESNISKELYSFFIKYYKVKEQKSELDRQLNQREKAGWSSLSDIAPLVNKFNELQKQVNALIAEFYRKKMETFSHRPLKEQILLVIESELRMNAFTNANDLRQEMRDAWNKARSGQGKTALEDLEKPLIELKKCFENAPQGNTREHDIQCVEKILSIVKM